MIITQQRLREIISSEINRSLLESPRDSCDTLIAAIIASEVLHDGTDEERMAIFDVLKSRVRYRFKSLEGGIHAQATHPRQFSGYTWFGEKYGYGTDRANREFIEFYSGMAPDQNYHTSGLAPTALLVSVDEVETTKMRRRQQFDEACRVVVNGANRTGLEEPTYGATHFVNPGGASTGNRWWATEGWRPIPGERVGDHVFGWVVPYPRQSRESFEAFLRNNPQFASIYKE